MSFLLDTNAVSEWTKPKPDPGLAAWLGSTNEEFIFLSVVTLAEIKFGIERLAAGRRRASLENWLGDELIARFDGRLLSIDGQIAQAWGKIVASCAALGRPIGIMGGFIAAIAAEHQLTLVTCNGAHFADAKITLLNPWSPSG